jgi:nitrite reductase/ring-hydroxylating ferredoxin subunit
MSEAFQSFNPGDRIADPEELSPGQTKLLKVCLGGRDREAILLKTEEGYLSYLNRCRHLAVPLDWGDGEVMDDSGKLFLCRTHGALFRPKDGFCVSGPCQGLSLFPIDIAVREDGIYLSNQGSSY